MLIFSSFFKLATPANNMVNFDELKSTDVRSAWSLCAVDISKVIFSSELVTVPRLEDAPYFDLMVCFSQPNPKGLVKHVRKLIHHDKDFCLQGHLSDLVLKEPKEDQKGSNMKGLLTACEATIKADLLNDEATFHVEDDGKSVTIKFQNLEKEVVNWSTLSEGDLVFDLDELDMQGRRTLYVITEVIYAKGLTIDVKVDNAEYVDDISARIPVAFSYTKFPIDANGVLKSAKDTKVDIHATFDSPSSSF